MKLTLKRDLPLLLAALLVSLCGCTTYISRIG